MAERDRPDDVRADIRADLQAAKEGAEQQQHLYRPLYRPAGSSTLPPGVKFSFAETPQTEALDIPGVPVSRHPYGVISTNRALTPEEIKRYELVEHAGAATHAQTAQQLRAVADRFETSGRVDPQSLGALRAAADNLDPPQPQSKPANVQANAPGGPRPAPPARGTAPPVVP